MKFGLPFQLDTTKPLQTFCHLHRLRSQIGSKVWPATTVRIFLLLYAYAYMYVYIYIYICACAYKCVCISLPLSLYLFLHRQLLFIYAYYAYTYVCVCVWLPFFVCTVPTFALLPSSATLSSWARADGFLLWLARIHWPPCPFFEGLNIDWPWLAIYSYTKPSHFGVKTNVSHRIDSIPGQKSFL